MSPGLLASILKRRNLLLMAGNSAWLLADKLLRVGLGVVVGGVVARYLGPDSYGKLNFVFAYVLLLASVAAFGLDAVVVRELIKDETGKHDILGTAFLIKCCCALTAFVAGNSLVRVIGIDVDDIWLLVAIASSSLLFSALDVTELRFQSRLDGRSIVTARSSAFVLVSAIKLLLVAIGAPLAYFAATPAMEAAVAAALLLVIYSLKEGDVRRWRFDRSRATGLIRTAAPIAASGFLVAATMHIDKLVLGNISGHHDVGLYSAASLLSTVWYMVPVVVGASVAPVLTRLHDSSRVEYEKKLQDVFSALNFAALCIGIFIALLSKPLIVLIFGEAYAASASILIIHVWTGLFVAHVSIRSRALLIEGNTKLVALFSGLTLLANVCLNLLLIPGNGAIGAAWASSISWGLCALLFPLYSRQSRGFAWMLLKSFVPASWMRALTG